MTYVTISPPPPPPPAPTFTISGLTRDQFEKLRVLIGISKGGTFGDLYDAMNAVEPRFNSPYRVVSVCDPSEAIPVYTFIPR